MDIKFKTVEVGEVFFETFLKDGMDAAKAAATQKAREHRAALKVLAMKGKQVSDQLASVDSDLVTLVQMA